jgi:hypothetical protein
MTSHSTKKSRGLLHNQNPICSSQPKLILAAADTILTVFGDLSEKSKSHVVTNHSN